MKKNDAFEKTVELVESSIASKDYYIISSYITAFFLAGTGYPLAAYALLAAFSTPRLATYRWPRLSLRGTLKPALYAVLPHALLWFTATLTPSPQPTLYVAAIAAALIEETFFRLTLEEHGEPLTALLYSLFHVSFRTPVYLVSSTLFVPAYFLLGCFFYQVYRRSGLPAAYAAHATFNIAALLYVTDFSPLQALLFTAAVGFTYLLYRCSSA